MVSRNRFPDRMGGVEELALRPLVQGGERDEELLGDPRGRAPDQVAVGTEDREDPGEPPVADGEGGAVPLLLEGGQGDPEDLRDLRGIGDGLEGAVEPRHVGRDAEPRDREHVVEGPEVLQAIRGDPDLLGGLPGRVLPTRRVGLLPVPPGERDLALVAGQLRGAAGEEHMGGAVPLGQEDQHRGLCAAPQGQVQRVDAAQRFSDPALLHGVLLLLGLPGYHGPRPRPRQG